MVFATPTVRRPHAQSTDKGTALNQLHLITPNWIRLHNPTALGRNANSLRFGPTTRLFRASFAHTGDRRRSCLLRSLACYWFHRPEHSRASPKHQWTGGPIATALTLGRSLLRVSAWQIPFRFDIVSKLVASHVNRQLPFASIALPGPSYAAESLPHTSSHYQYTPELPSDKSPTESQSAATANLSLN